MSKIDRKNEFAEIGARLAEKIGTVNVTRKAIADEASVSGPLVARYLGNKDDMHAAINNALRRLKLKQPDKKEVARIGQEMRRKPRPVEKVAKPKVEKVAKPKVEKVAKVEKVEKVAKPKRVPKLPPLPAATA